ncbi:MAG: phosphoglycerol transferase family protein alkaline phosphatase superfamily [Planctomycetota bacterium]|nr:phosphoglycerol transferase family protein alkaline phosphatase superfamily [Planctomycetota bacterium]
MLSLGNLRGRTCGGVSRRAFLQVGGLGALGLNLADLIAMRAQAQGARPQAKAVIVLWLWGGPSHLETFDLKPDAPLEYRGPFEPIATPVPGLRVCELLPGLAKRADKFAILRAMHHESNDHGVAGTIALTGNIAGAVGLDGKSAAGATRPSTGAIVGRVFKDRGAAKGTLPPYVILGSQLHQGLKRVVGEGGGTLGTTFDPFRLDYEPGVGLKLPDVQLPESVTAQRLGARWDLLRKIDTTNPASRPHAVMGRNYELAHDMIVSRESLAALDVTRESPRTRERYGPHRFGQCCLIARRLVETGLPFVQVNWSTHVECPEDAGDGGWDMHDRYFQIMQDRHGWMLDRALSALLDDLQDRRLLDTTMVLAVGEFGRMPKINDKAGREHWNQCYSALIAGGGIQGGRAIGSSDRRGEHPIDRPATPADLGATILSRLGIGAAEMTGIGLNPMGQVIDELF